VAAGEKLSFSQEEIRWSGHAIECRVNAEDPDQDFLPCPGVVSLYHPPGGPNVRVDSHLFTGYRIPPHYDSLLGKIIVHGKNRQEAIRTMLRALDEMTVEPMRTTVSFHRRVLEDRNFVAGNYSTDFVERLSSASKSAGELVGA